MKLNLGCHNDIRPNYINIDTYDENGSDNYKKGNINCLDWLVENDSVEEIISLNSLNRIPTKELTTSLQNWVAKLKPKGTLKIAIPDIYLIAKSFVDNQMPIPEFLQLIFGSEQTHNSALDSDMLLDILKNCQLSLLNKRYDGMSFYVEAQKNV